jgi:hypothetical protein
MSLTRIPIMGPLSEALRKAKPLAGRLADFHEQVDRLQADHQAHAAEVERARTGDVLSGEAAAEFLRSAAAELRSRELEIRRSGTALVEELGQLAQQLISDAATAFTETREAVKADFAKQGYDGQQLTFATFGHPKLKAARARLEECRGLQGVLLTWRSTNFTAAERLAEALEASRQRALAGLSNSPQGAFR